MLVTDGRLVPGEHVLIRGIGRPIAIASLQIAAHLRARIILTATEEDHLKKAKVLGAAHGILETSEFEKEVRQLTARRGVDLAVDCVGGEYWSKTLACLARGGRVATCAASDRSNPPTDLRRIFWNNLSVFGCACGSRQDFLEALRFVEQTNTQPAIDRVLPLDNLLEQPQSGEGTPFGSIVVAIA
jgi:NADPH2:quinone reductase